MHTLNYQPGDGVSIGPNDMEGKQIQKTQEKLLHGSCVVKWFVAREFKEPAVGAGVDFSKSNLGYVCRLARVPILDFFSTCHVGSMKDADVDVGVPDGARHLRRGSGQAGRACNDEKDGPKHSVGVSGCAA